MKRNFVAAKEYIEKEFPEMRGRISGGNYPTPPTIEFLQQVLQAVQLLAMALMIFGDGLWTNVFRFSQVPEWYFPIKAYGFPLCLAIFFILPQALSRYAATGAFEMYLDGKIFFSKLQMGRMPSIVDITDPLSKFGLTPLSSR
mmetsp:Transcript_5578/g.9702  ORF Transcript_5578/g.9702 Transcript_5578/m.9702 type:complete len:143 (+) Transcript_5578:223-651(+)